MFTFIFHPLNMYSVLQLGATCICFSVVVPSVYLSLQLGF